MSFERRETVTDSQHDDQVLLDDLFVEHYDPPVWTAPKVSAARKGRLRRRVPHHRSLLGIALLGGLIAGAGFLGYKRWFA